MKIPFDINYIPQIESGEYKVETKDGLSVRIICWDKKSEKKYGYHIVGLIEFGPQHEESTYYTIDGKGKLKDKEPDLFIVTPEEELTEFEKAVYDCAWGKVACKTEGESKEEYAKRHAAELLSLARKELENEAPSIIEAQSFKEGIKAGKAEALKDLPRWRRWENGACGNSHGIPIAIVKQGIDYKLVSSLGIQGEHYIILSDLEKLPGFKED